MVQTSTGGRGFQIDNVRGFGARRKQNVSEGSGVPEGCLRSLAVNALTGIETSVGTLADTRNIPYGNIPVSSNALVGRGCSATRRDTSRGYR